MPRSTIDSQPPAASHEHTRSSKRLAEDTRRSQAKDSRKISAQPVHNRIRALLAHTTRYAFKGESRLAKDSGISRSALNRVVCGQSSPSFALVSAITRVLERSLGCRIDPHDVISLDGKYPTPLVCSAAGCRGCLPDFAYDSFQQLRPEWRGIAPGQWSGSVEPNGSEKVVSGKGVL